jgi:tRNA G18 (ribose-2'-O)-methylase SpoU
MIDDYRKIADAPLLRERGLFVAEGRFVVRRVIGDPQYTIHSLLLNDAAHRDLGSLLGRLPAGTPIHIRPPDEIAAVTGVKFHRGCLALVRRPPAAPLDSILDAPSPIVLLEDIANPDNVGGVFRNAAAFGAGGIIISPGCCDPLYRKAVRTSMGAVLRVPYARPDDWRAAIERVRRRGLVLVALTPRQPSEPLGEFAQRARAMKVALALGSEGAGVSETVGELADARVGIPIAGDVDSLNLAVAAGIALFALRS